MKVLQREASTLMSVSLQQESHRVTSRTCHSSWLSVLWCRWWVAMVGCRQVGTQAHTINRRRHFLCGTSGNLWTECRGGSVLKQWGVGVIVADAQQSVRRGLDAWLHSAVSGSLGSPQGMLGRIQEHSLPVGRLCMPSCPPPFHPCKGECVYYSFWI